MAKLLVSIILYCFWMTATEASFDQWCQIFGSDKHNDRTVQCNYFMPDPISFPDPNITILILNNLTHNINNSVFTVLKYLNEIVIDGGFNVTISENTFRNMTSLKRLSLVSIGISSLEPPVFDSLINLQHLNLEGNRLENISGQLFQKLTNLQTLDLSNNNISEITQQTFQNLNNLKYLNLSGNTNITIERTAFRYLKQLVVFANRRVCAHLIDPYICVDQNRYQTITRIDINKSKTSEWEISWQPHSLETITKWTICWNDIEKPDTSICTQSPTTVYLLHTSIMIHKKMYRICVTHNSLDKCQSASNCYCTITYLNGVDINSIIIAVTAGLGLILLAVVSFLIMAWIMHTRVTSVPTQKKNCYDLEMAVKHSSLSNDNTPQIHIIST